MKKVIVLLLMLILTINILPGCDNDKSTEWSIQEGRKITDFDELDEIPKGSLTFADFIFIDEETSMYDVVEKNGQPDALFGSDMNIRIWFYKLADGGMFSFEEALYGDIVSVSYEELIIIIAAPADYLESAYKDYIGTTRVVFFQDVM